MMGKARRREGAQGVQFSRLNQNKLESEITKIRQD